MLILLKLLCYFLVSFLQKVVTITESSGDNSLRVTLCCSHLRDKLVPFVKEIPLLYRKEKGEEGRQEVLYNHSLSTAKELKKLL